MSLYVPFLVPAFLSASRPTQSLAVQKQAACPAAGVVDRHSLGGRDVAATCALHGAAGVAAYAAAAHCHQETELRGSSRWTPSILQLAAAEGDGAAWGRRS
jgi:hypothetical protein